MSLDLNFFQVLGAIFEFFFLFFKKGQLGSGHNLDSRLCTEWAGAKNAIIYYDNNNIDIL